MELNDLKAAWQELNSQVKRQNEINLQLCIEQKTNRAQAQFHPLMYGQWFQLAVGIVTCLVFGQFWWNHLVIPHLIVCGLFLHAFGVVLIVFAVRELLLIRSVDFSQNVVEIQKKLAQLQTWRVRVGTTIGVLSSFIWLPLLVVGFQWLNIDVLRQGPNAIYWLFANIVVCVCLAVGFVFWRRRTGATLDELTGTDKISLARKDLDAIENFIKHNKV